MKKKSGGMIEKGRFSENRDGFGVGMTPATCGGRGVDLEK
ncbi:uncharacterized protein G2W53_023718 [Senna tora]|uniref:Uncharacterized protein n=1 Tax=Senna tora TaxID=362788 RepID=A0A834T9Z6_9FABA|nr:uncharacterized protein G2W53_023718 [Senna tora]